MYLRKFHFGGGEASLNCARRMFSNYFVVTNEQKRSNIVKVSCTEKRERLFLGATHDWSLGRRVSVYIKNTQVVVQFFCCFILISWLKRTTVRIS